MSNNPSGEKFESLRDEEELATFLSERGCRHQGYYHYTDTDVLESMLKSGRLHFSRADQMNDWEELEQGGDVEKWKRIYIMSFVYGSNESVAMWANYAQHLPSAIRIQIAAKSIKRLLKVLNSRKDFKIYRVEEIEKKDSEKKYNYIPLQIQGIHADLRDIVYQQENALWWNENHLPVRRLWTENRSEIRTRRELIGFVKHFAWHHENETRLVLELPDGLEDYPKKIAVAQYGLLKDAEILCGPWMSMDDLPQKVKEAGLPCIESELMGKIQKPKCAASIVK